MTHQKVRRGVQIAVFSGMFLVPVFNLWELYFIRGTFISMDIGSAAVSDPVMILQTIFASQTLNFAVLASAAVPVLLVLLLGRVWCGWGCPYTAMMEWLEKIPFIRKVAGQRHAKIAGGADSKRAGIARYLILMILLLFVGVLGVPVLYMISPPAVMSTQALLAVKGLAVTAGLAFIAIAVVIDLFVSYRFVCRYLCPTGTCLSMMTTRRSLHVGYAGKCIDCKKCIRACPMGLNPMTQAQDRLCYNCGACIAACPDERAPLRWEI